MSVKPPAGGYKPPGGYGQPTGRGGKRYIHGFNPAPRGNAPEILSGRGGMQQPGMGGGFGSPGMSGGGFGNQMSNGFGGGQASGMSGLAPGGPDTMGHKGGPWQYDGDIIDPRGDRRPMPNQPGTERPTNPGPNPDPPGPTDFQPPDRGPTGPMGPTGTPGTPGRPNTPPRPPNNPTPFNPI